jgi:hypothetical protein
MEVTKESKLILLKNQHMAQDAIKDITSDQFIKIRNYFETTGIIVES